MLHMILSGCVCQQHFPDCQGQLFLS